MYTINRTHLAKLIDRENKQFRSEHPKSRALLEEAKNYFIGGVPMHWMEDAPGDIPPFIDKASGSYITDVDGHTYLDLCLGGSAALSGHSPKIVAEAVALQAAKGITTLLPSEDCIWVGKELTRRFGLAKWQVYLSATDANRFAVRVARHVTNRFLVLVYDGCYHGTLDESLVSVVAGSRKAMGHDVLGGIPDPASRVIHFNDLEALEKALKPKDIACVLTEPALTNGGIVFPEPGYLDSLQKLTQQYGTLLIIDETHTITGGPGGLTRKWNLKSDIFTMGKPIGGGIPSSIVGFSSEIADKLVFKSHFPIGIGGTLSGNPLQIAAIKANLEHILTEAHYEHLINMANIIGDHVDNVIAQAGLPWHLDRIGGRLEHGYSPHPFHNFAEYLSTYDPEIDILRRLYMANRGVWVTPVHSTMHICPQVTLDDTKKVNKTFTQFVNELVR